ncbi:MAG: metallophosphoesterase, partial [Nocardiopsaceae bacterium]|nr:metallophosphoesterase [Nocardiopsaceae bacterium]
MTGFGAQWDTAPGRILVAGDWHGNRLWAVNVIRRIPQLLNGEEPRIILHLGDFGIWPDDEGRRYLTTVSSVLAEQDAELWFVDGNHE